MTHSANPLIICIPANRKKCLACDEKFPRLFASARKADVIPHCLPARAAENAAYGVVLVKAMELYLPDDFVSPDRCRAGLYLPDAYTQQVWPLRLADFKGKEE